MEEPKPQRPTTKTASTCAAEAARGTHTFRIASHNLYRGLGVGKYIRSATFEVGGYQWCVRYYPDGHKEDRSIDHVSIFVELVSKNSKARVRFDVWLLDQVTGLSSSVFFQKTPLLFSSPHIKGPSWGSELARLVASDYLRDDSLVIEVDLTVTKAPTEVVPPVAIDIQVPPSDLSDNLRELLEAAEDADVTFNIDGEVFPAHKIVLAMRLPVFKAELFRPMREKTKQSIAIEDMQPAVFKALLHFIYMDSLPPMDDLNGDHEREEIVKHLLMAADRYAMERMRLMCESILCRSLDVENVATTLALADQHHCSSLKDACVEFILSPSRTDGVVASQGYAHLKRSYSAVIADVFERSTNCRRI